MSNGGIALRIRKTMLLSILMVVVFLSACRQPTQEERFIQSQKFLTQLKSYYAVVKYQIIEEDEIREYSFKQWVQLPDRFKILMISPKELEGKLMISDGKEIWIHHPVIKDSLRFDMPMMKEQKPIFIGNFIVDYWLSEDVKKEMKNIGEQEYIVLECPSLGGSGRGNRQLLWLNSRNMAPAQLVTCSSEGETISTVSFKEFNGHWNPPKDFFEIPSQSIDN